MNIFRAVFKLEMRRFPCTRNLLIIALVFVLSLILVQDGASSYKSNMEDVDTFVKIEKAKVRQYVFYTQYGAYGIRLMFIPSPEAILFNNNGVFSQLGSNVDVGERLNIYNSFKGKNLFSGSDRFMNFGGFLLFFGALFSMLYGFEGFKDKEFFRYLLSFTGNRPVFFSIITARAILIVLTLVVILAAVCVLLLINGVNLINTSILVLFVILSLVLVFFMLIGAFCGMMKNRSNGIFSAILIFFILFMVYPWLLDKIYHSRARNLPSIYKVELDKLRLIMKFEEEFYKKFGIYRSGKVAPEYVKKEIKSYIDNEYKDIVHKENNFKNAMGDIINNNQLFSSFIPTTFCLSAYYEISSKGYKNFMAFYDYNQEIKHSFFEDYIHAKFEKPKDQVESFIKRDENLYRGKSRLPGSFGLGLLLLLFYNGCLFYIVSRRFRNYLYTAWPEDLEPSGDVSIRLNPGEYTLIKITDKKAVYPLYDRLSGRDTGFKGQVLWQNEPVSPPAAPPFIYFCSPEHLPVCLSVRHYLDFLTSIGGDSAGNREDIEEDMDLLRETGVLEKTLGKLNEVEKCRVMLAGACIIKRSVYLFNNFATGMPDEIYNNLHKQISRLKENGGSIIYITTDTMFASAKVDQWITILREGGRFKSQTLEPGTGIVPPKG